MGRTYRQLDFEERHEISRRRRAGESIRAIAAALDRAPSSIARELTRNTGTQSYQPRYADQQAAARRWRGSRLLRQPALQADVLARLAAGASPVSVCGRLQREQGHRVLSAETIYRFIQAQIARTKDYRWRHYLPCGHSRRGRRRARGPRVRIPERVGLDARPAAAESRRQPGHWEADLMLFSTYGQAVLALHERHSRLTLIVRAPSKAADPMAATLADLLRPLPERLRRTLTFDNGSEFARHHRLRDALPIQTFFCDPHAPWQKGGVENAIGRLRRWLPRHTNLDTLSTDDFLDIARRYNHLPRPCLDFQTPAEVFSRLLHFKCESTFPLSRE